MAEQQTVIEELPLIQSQNTTERTLVRIQDISEEHVGKVIEFRGFLAKNRSHFLVIRDQIATIQVYTTAKANIPVESYVEIKGLVTKPEKPVTGCTKQLLEIQAEKVSVISKSVQPLPIQVEDCARITEADEDKEEQAEEDQFNGKTEEQPQLVLKTDAEGNPIDEQTGEKLTPEQIEKRKKNFLKKLEKEKAKAAKKAAKNAAKTPTVTQKLRLDNRVLDLRTMANQAIFRLQSKVCQFFREYLYSKDFQEIHTPKLIPTASEGGSNVFEVKYFDGKAYLAQSPQLYKQMAVVSGMPRVFEIGPVFRAEKSFTHRHLTEFTGLDAEMAFDTNYHEAMLLFQDLLCTVFTRLQKECQPEIEAVAAQFGAHVKDLVIKPCVVNYKDAVKLLNENGHPEMGMYDDLNSEQEKCLGKLVREKYGTDFFILDKFPAAVRPFYTMPDPEDPLYSNSYDMFLRGEEIVSGAQRIHNSELLLKRAAELKVDMTPIMAYVDSFKYGAPPHAGLGCGLDRITFLFLGLHNVRRGSLFPRDPTRVTP